MARQFFPLTAFGIRCQLKDVRSVVQSKHGMGLGIRPAVLRVFSENQANGAKGKQPRAR